MRVGSNYRGGFDFALVLRAESASAIAQKADRFEAKERDFGDSLINGVWVVVRCSWADNAVLEAFAAGRVRTVRGNREQ